MFTLSQLKALIARIEAHHQTRTDTQTLDPVIDFYVNGSLPAIDEDFPTFLINDEVRHVSVEALASGHGRYYSIPVHHMPEEKRSWQK